MAYYTVFPDGLSSNLKIIGGQHTTASAADSLTFDGISTIVSAIVGLGEDSSDTVAFASGSFTGGTLTISTFTFTDTASDCTPAAIGSVFGNTVNYIVVGY